MKDILKKLMELDQSSDSVEEGTTVDTPTGRIHKGSYGSSYNDDDSADSSETKTRGRPKKDSEAGSGGKKYDFSQLMKPVKAPDIGVKRVHKMTESAGPDEIGVTPQQIVDIVKLAGISNASEPVTTTTPAVPVMAPVDPVISYDPDLDSVETPNDSIDSDPSMDSFDSMPMNKILPEEEKEYSNSPDETTCEIDDILASGDDLHKSKRTYPKVAGGDNPMQAGPLRMPVDLLKEYERFVAEASRVDELSPKTLSNYASKAKAQGKMARHYANYGDPDDPQDVKDAYHKKADKRFAGAKQAASKIEKSITEARSPKFVKIDDFGSWENHLFGSFHNLEYDESEIEGYLVGIMIDPTNYKTYGMWYNKARYGSALKPPSEGFKNELHYASADPYWPETYNESSDYSRRHQRKGDENSSKKPAREEKKSLSENKKFKAARESRLADRLLNSRKARG